MLFMLRWITKKRLTTLRLLSLMWTFSSGQNSLVMLEKCPQIKGKAMMNRFWAGNSRHICKLEILIELFPFYTHWESSWKKSSQSWEIKLKAAFWLLLIGLWCEKRIAKHNYVVLFTPSGEVCRTFFFIQNLEPENGLQRAEHRNRRWKGPMSPILSLPVDPPSVSGK